MALTGPAALVSAALCWRSAARSPADLDGLPVSTPAAAWRPN